ncbi:MAG: hypothetical protein R3D52_08345 [Xanthobacteraceae bacterium]
MDFEDAATVFAGTTSRCRMTGETGHDPDPTYGFLGRRLVMVVWTQRGARIAT